MITQKEIEKGLVDVGLRKNMLIEVHSSLSSFGFVDGGAKSIIRALMNVVTKKGTILMPSFPLSKQKELSENDTQQGITIKKSWLPHDHMEKTDMGTIADTFRLQKDVVTGIGKNRFSAWGMNARNYINDFFSTVENSYCLLIGVDITKLSAMHLAEKYITSEYWLKLFPERKSEENENYDQNKWFIGYGEDIKKYFGGWLKIQEDAINKHLIKIHMLGNSKWLFFKTKKIVDIYENLIKNNIKELYEI